MRYLILGLSLVAIGAGLLASHYYDKATEWRAAAQQSQRLVKHQAAAIADLTQRQQLLAALDKTHTEALSVAESQNDALRRQLAAGTRRMYVNAKCPASGAGTAAGTSGMGDGTAVELSADSRHPRRYHPRSRKTEIFAEFHRSGMFKLKWKNDAANC